MPTGVLILPRFRYRKIYGKRLWAMFQSQDLVHLSCPEGVFSGYLQRVKITASGVSIGFMVYEKLT